jgi:hypothetical protein
MSKYLAFTDIVFTNEAILIAALGDLGYTEVERGDDLPLYGYKGDIRVERAQLVVCRKHIGPASNDLGFAHTSQGYTPIISEYDQRTLLGGKFLARLRTAYNERVVTEMQRRMSGTLQRTVEGATVKLKIRY